MGRMQDEAASGSLKNDDLKAEVATEKKMKAQRDCRKASQKQPNLVTFIFDIFRLPIMQTLSRKNPSLFEAFGTHF